jgi:hypothetical protein
MEKTHGRFNRRVFHLEFYTEVKSVFTTPASIVTEDAGFQDPISEQDITDLLAWELEISSIDVPVIPCTSHSRRTSALTACSEACSSAPASHPDHREPLQNYQPCSVTGESSIYLQHRPGSRRICKYGGKFQWFSPYPSA